jgi:tetratricopeptide (TPR) repeat protein
MRILLFCLLCLASTPLVAQPSKAPTKEDLRKADKLAERAEKDVSAGKYDAALNGYVDAYALSPNPEYLLRAGECYYALDRYDDAIATLTKYLEIVPAHQVAGRNAAEKALKDARDAKDIDTARQLFEKAEVQYGIQNYEAALDNYKKSYELSLAPELLYNLGQCYRALKRYDEAKKSYQAFLRQKSDPNPKRQDTLDHIDECEKAIAASLAPATKPYVPPPASQALPNPNRDPNPLPPPVLKSDAKISAGWYVGSALSGVVAITGGVIAAGKLGQISRGNAPGSARNWPVFAGASAAGVVGAVGCLVVGKQRAKESAAQVTLTPQGASLALHW